MSYRKNGVDKWGIEAPVLKEPLSLESKHMTQAEEVDDCKTILLSTELNSALP